MSWALIQALIGSKPMQANHRANGWTSSTSMTAAMNTTHHNTEHHDVAKATLSKIHASMPVPTTHMSARDSGIAVLQSKLAAIPTTASLYQRVAKRQRVMRSNASKQAAIDHHAGANNSPTKPRKLLATSSEASLLLEAAVRMDASATTSSFSGVERQDNARPPNMQAQPGDGLRFLVEAGIEANEPSDLQRPKQAMLILSDGRQYPRR